MLHVLHNNELVNIFPHTVLYKISSTLSEELVTIGGIFTTVYQEVYSAMLPNPIPTYHTAIL